METIRRYYSIDQMISILDKTGFKDIKWNYGYEYPNEKVCGNYLIKARKG